jgi:hypothetical protein
MQNLFAFLYAFEPQLDSLHPEHRQHDNENCSFSLRKHSSFIRNWWHEHGQLPTIMQGVIELLKEKKDQMELLNAVRCPFNDKSMRCNVSNLVRYLQDESAPGNTGIPTIEFRQHEGPLDAQRVVQWCSTVVGIINFVDSADQVYFRKLLLKVVDETWEKEGCPKDVFQQDELGPIPTEGSFTVIDLFRYIHLNEQAKFYSSRLNPVVGRPPIARPTVWKWEYEMYSYELLTDEEYQRQHTLRLLSEKSLTAGLAQSEGSSFRFDPDDEMWPKHVRVNGWSRQAQPLWDADQENVVRGGEMRELLREGMTGTEGYKVLSSDGGEIAQTNCIWTMMRSFCCMIVKIARLLLLQRCTNIEC